MVSEGDIYELRISSSSLDFNLGNYFTNRLDNITILINMPAVTPNNFVAIVTGFDNGAGYIRFTPQIIYGNYLPYPGGSGTLTFIP
jgi:hypothetical protein